MIYIIYVCVWYVNTYHKIYTHTYTHKMCTYIITKYTLEQCLVQRAIIAIICNTSCSKKIRKEKVANMLF